MTRWLLVLAACAPRPAVVSNRVAPSAPVATPVPNSFETLAVTLAPRCGDTPRLVHLTAWGFRLVACGQSLFVRCSEIGETDKICCMRMANELTTTEETWEGTTEGGTCVHRQVSEIPGR